MTEVFKTILLQSVSGSVVVIALSLLMLFFGKLISGSVQKFLWILALISMLIPLWRFIPEDYAEKVIVPYDIDYYFNYSDVQTSDEADFDRSGHYQVAERKVSIMSIITPFWLSGTVIFMLLNVFGYIIFIIRKRRLVNQAAFYQFANLILFQRVCI